MLNVFSIYNHTINSVVSHQVLKEKTSPEDIAKIKDDLIFYVEDVIHNILINMSDSYPEAPVSGGTIRMRQAVHEINRVEDD